MMEVMVAEAQVHPEATLQKAFSCPSGVNFAPLLEVPRVKALARTNAPLFETLKVFAYGTIEDLPKGVKLPEVCLNKLRQLSMITYASQNRELHYADLMQKFGISSKRDLEDLVIDAIYNSLIKAHLDSGREVVLVDDWMARDVPNTDSAVPEMANVLGNWLKNTENTQQEALDKANKADDEMRAKADKKAATDKEINDAKAAVEEVANRGGEFQRNDHPAFPSSSGENGTPRSKRRNPLGVRGTRPFSMQK